MSCTSSATDPVSGPEGIMLFLATGGSVWLGVLWRLSSKERPQRILCGCYEGLYGGLLGRFTGKWHSG